MSRREALNNLGLAITTGIMGYTGYDGHTLAKKRNEAYDDIQRTIPDFNEKALQQARSLLREQFAESRQMPINRQPDRIPQQNLIDVYRASMVKEQARAHEKEVKARLEPLDNRINRDAFVFTVSGAVELGLAYYNGYMRRATSAFRNRITEALRQP